MVSPPVVSIFRVLGNLQRTLSDLMSNLRLNIWILCSGSDMYECECVVFSYIIMYYGILGGFACRDNILSELEMIIALFSS